MNANIKNRTIEMTKNEAKAAGKLGTDKFNELREYQTAYPTFKIKIVASHQNSGQFKGLTYEYMKKFIDKCDREDKDEIINKFNELTGAEKKKDKKRDEVNHIEVASYLDVKKWFLKTFPEIEKFKENQKKKIEEILYA